MAVATIVDVMESWPLGLRLRLEDAEAGAPGEEVLRDLAEDCVVERGGERLDVGDLRAGRRVRFDADGKVLTHVELL